MTAAPLVRIDGRVKHDGKVEAVNGIDLETRRGAVIGILAPTARARARRSGALFDKLPVTPEGIERWTREASIVYAEGAFTAPPKE